MFSMRMACRRDFSGIRGTIRGAGFGGFRFGTKVFFSERFRVRAVSTRGAGYIYVTRNSEILFMPSHDTASIWIRLKRTMNHAFAMPPPLDLSDDDRAILDRIADMVVRRRLTAPAIMILELARPLNFVAGQFLHFVGPFATLLLKEPEYKRFAEILEHRQGIDALLNAINSRASNDEPAETDTPPETHGTVE
jgi:hypothetical protein